MTLRSATLYGLVVAVCLGGWTEAAQRRRRGPNRTQMKAAQEQAAYMQLEMVRYQTEMAQKQQEIYSSFDADGDGTLKGPEKSKFDKHMKEIQSGKVPNPFATIQPIGQGPRPKSPMEELKQRAADYQNGIAAKQQEIFNSFDENGDGNLAGAEKTKFERHMRDIQMGRKPNPFAALATGGAGGSAPAK